MQPGQTVAIDRDQRVDEVVTAYLRAVESGQKPDRQQWLADHPDIAPDLAEFFADEDRMQRLVTPRFGIGPTENTPRPDLNQLVKLSAPATLGRFGDYELLEEIARGGMGVIYRARQISVHRVVALKMILAGKLASASERQRFHTEAEAAAQLDHANIVPIYDVGEHEGQPFFTMKLIEGGSLVDWLPCRETDWPVAIALLARVARAVHFAHRCGILHRDLKPANILLASREPRVESPEPRGHNPGPALRLSTLDSRLLTPLITDFGLAKLMQRGSDLTRSGAVVGTPSYMAPEQARGHQQAITTAADVYSLGAILYEVLTGSPPFRGETPLDTLLLVLEKEPANPRRINPRVDSDLATICLKCLAKEPHGRYESAEALADDLENWLERKPIQARPASLWERSWKWARRERTKAALIAAVAAIVLLFAGGGPLATIGWLRARDHAQKEALAHQETRDAKDDALKARNVAEERAEAEKDAKHKAQEATLLAEQREKEVRLALAREKLQAYHARITLADRNWHAHNLPRVHQLLEECPPTLRQWEWHYLNRLAARRELHSWKAHHSSGVLWAAFSPDGQQIASLGWDNTVRVCDAETGRVAWSHAADCSWGKTIVFGPEGRLLAFPHSAGQVPVVRVWDIQKNREIHQLKGHQGSLLGIAFSRDGQHIASAGTDGCVKLWDAAGGKELRSLRLQGQSPWCLAFSPDGERLAVGTQQGAVQVWDVAGGEKKLSFAAHADMIHGICFSPDGKTLATASFDQTVKLWSAETGQAIATHDSHNGLVFCVAFSPDGKRLASTCCDQTVRIWDAASREELYTLSGHGRPVMCVAFSPVQDRVVSASSDGTIRTWNIRTMQDSRAFPGPGGPVRSACLMPDGRRIAALAQPTGAPGEIRIWDLVSGKSLLTLPDASGQVAVSPDGRLVAAASSGASVKVWDARTGKETQVFKGHTYRADCLAFSPDGRLLASVAALPSKKDARMTAEIKLWDLAGGRVKWTVLGHHQPLIREAPVHAVAFSPDGKFLATAGNDGFTRLWDAGQGQSVFTTSREKPGKAEAVRCVTFSPDGRFLAEAHGLFVDRPQITLWDLTTRQKTAVLMGHQGVIYSLAFTTDSSRLASAGMDRTVKLWDVARHEEVLTLRGHKSTVYSVAFSRDGLRLVAVSGDQTVRVWDATPLPATK